MCGFYLLLALDKSLERVPDLMAEVHLIHTFFAIICACSLQASAIFAFPGTVIFRRDCMFIWDLHNKHSLDMVFRVGRLDQCNDKSNVCHLLQVPSPSFPPRVPTSSPESRIPNFESIVPSPESRVPNPESRVPTSSPESWVPNPESQILSPGSWVPNPEFWVLGHESRIPTSSP